MFQFWLPATIWPRVFDPAAAYCTPGNLRDRRRVVGRQRAGVALALPHAALREVAGRHDDHVGAGRLDLRLDRGLRAGAERHHRDDGGDADDHAEHRQRRPHLVAAQRLERDAENHQDTTSSAPYDRRFGRRAAASELVLREPPLARPDWSVDDLRRRGTTTMRVPYSAMSVFVRDEHHGDAALPVQTLEDAHHFDAGSRVEVPGRLVRQQNRRVVDQRARDRDALLLAARQLIRDGDRRDSPRPTASSTSSARL